MQAFHGLFIVSSQSLFPLSCGSPHTRTHPALLTKPDSQHPAHQPPPASRDPHWNIPSPPLCDAPMLPPHPTLCREIRGRRSSSWRTDHTSPSIQPQRRRRQKRRERCFSVHRSTGASRFRREQRLDFRCNVWLIRGVAPWSVATGARTRHDDMARSKASQGADYARAPASCPHAPGVQLIQVRKNGSCLRQNSAAAALSQGLCCSAVGSNEDSVRVRERRECMRALSCDWTYSLTYLKLIALARLLLFFSDLVTSLGFVSSYLHLPPAQQILLPPQGAAC